MPAAQQRKAEGADVVAAYIETHKRPEIEELLAGSLWKNAVVARANALDSRHTKRYQDVEELLKVGIDIYTTMNVQHLESLNDVVARITEVVVRETVPDRILGRADQIVLVDLPPEELIQRLHEGKVYVQELIGVAVAQFQTGQLEIDLSNRRVRVSGQEVQLTPTEYDLLRILVNHAEKVLTHGQPLKEVRGIGYQDETHLLRVHMSNLRRKLELDPNRPQYILTEPGVGYRLSAED
jgi:DNA-binding response OmpR family regulator